MSDFVTSSDIVAIEDQLREVDPKLLGDPAMLAAMAVKLNAESEDEAMVRQMIIQYVAFRWPQFRRDLTRSLNAGELKGALLRDAQQRKARGN